jgi:hypothetical protein
VLSCPQCGASYPDTVRLCPKDGAVLESSVPTHERMIGVVLDDKYRLDAFLSSGVMGAVFRATHVGCALRRDDRARRHDGGRCAAGALGSDGGDARCAGGGGWRTAVTAAAAIAPPATPSGQTGPTMPAVAAQAPHVAKPGGALGLLGVIAAVIVGIAGLGGALWQFTERGPSSPGQAMASAEPAPLATPATALPQDDLSPDPAEAPSADRQGSKEGQAGPAANAETGPAAANGAGPAPSATTAASSPGLNSAPVVSGSTVLAPATAGRANENARVVAIDAVRHLRDFQQR